MNAPRTSFADLHVAGQPFVLVNAWDVLSAVALAADGHPAIGTTSLGITAAVGLPDGARAARANTVALVRQLAGLLPAHLSVDLEDGYGDDPGAVADLVAELSNYGVVGVNLEDAHRDAHTHSAVIAAVKARAPSVFVNARTDVFWSGSRELADALRRLAAYRDAGADGVFAPGLTDPRAITRVVELGPPVNILWQSGADLSRLGVARISTGSALYRTALAAARGAAAAARAMRAPTSALTPYDETQRLLVAQAPTSRR